MFPEDREQYIVMHGALRGLLASLLGINAAQIRFSTNENGKPFVADFPPPHDSSNASLGIPAGNVPFVSRSEANDALRADSGDPVAGSVCAHVASAPQFSISHTKGLGLVAVPRVHCGSLWGAPPDEDHTRFASDGRVKPVEAAASIGVDVEYIRRDFPVEEIALRYFSPADAAALRATPVGDQRRAFFSAWVRKEAWVKAAGVGLDQLPFLDAAPGKSLDDGFVGKATEPQEGIASAWVQDLDAGASHAAALAVCGISSEVRRLIWHLHAGYW